MLMTDKEKLEFAKRFNDIKGIGNTDFIEEVKTTEKIQTQRLVAKLYPENKLIKTLFREYETHVFKLTKVAIEASTYKVDAKEVMDGDKTGVDEDTPITKQRIRVIEEDGLTVETIVETLEPVPIKEWKGVLLNDTVVTVGLITEPTQDLTNETKTPVKDVKEETHTNT